MCHRPVCLILSACTYDRMFSPHQPILSVWYYYPSVYQAKGLAAGNTPAKEPLQISGAMGNSQNSGFALLHKPCRSLLLGEVPKGLSWLLNHKPATPQGLLSFFPLLLTGIVLSCLPLPPSRAWLTCQPSLAQ